MSNPEPERKTPALQTAFLELLESPVGKRRETLDRVCRNDPALRSALSELLQLHEKACKEGFLDDPISLVSLGDLQVPQSSDDHPAPAMIGRYRITGRLGTGGLGVVYRAVAPAPATREVAIKVLRCGVSPGALTRFKIEQQALASLDHAGIARIYDSGVTESHDLFAVFELVDGLPLTAFAKQHRLAWRDRIGLLVQVCDAVQHAHNRGVIHRDLKPENLLVTKTDAGASVKVIDFGVSKLYQPSPRAARTEHGMLVGTLAYMAPEMIAGTGTVDTRADIYALGIILYELLEGCHPYQEHLASLPGLVRVVGTQPCPRLHGSYSGHRRDLDAVVRKATHADPECRYATPKHMADDLHRVLKERPVVARPPSGLDAFVKLLRRRMGAVTAAVVCAALVATLAYKVVSAGHQARSHRTALQQTVGSLADDVLAELAEMSGAGAARVRIAGLLNQRFEELRRQGADTPDIRTKHIRVLDVLSDDHLDHRRLDESEAIRRRVLVELDSLLSVQPGNRALRRAYARALVRIGDIANVRGDLDDALRWYTSAHHDIAGLLEEDPGDIGMQDDYCWSLERLADLRWRQGQEDEALRLTNRRLEIARELLTQHPAEPMVAFNTATAHLQKSNYSLLRGDHALAVEHGAEAAALSRELCLAEPIRFTYHRIDILALRQWARSLLAYGEFEKAAPAIENLRARSHAIERMNPTHWWAQRVARQVGEEFPPQR